MTPLASQSPGLVQRTAMEAAVGGHRRSEAAAGGGVRSARRHEVVVVHRRQRQIAVAHRPLDVRAVGPWAEPQGAELAAGNEPGVDDVLVDRRDLEGTEDLVARPQAGP